MEHQWRYGSCSTHLRWTFSSKEMAVVAVFPTVAVHLPVLAGFRNCGQTCLQHLGSPIVSSHRFRMKHEAILP